MSDGFDPLETISLWGILKSQGYIIMEKSRFRDNKNNKFENIRVQFMVTIILKRIYLSLWLF
jgi:hypothetical protein